MQPLAIRFSLITEMILPEAPIHLDALLAWAAVDAAGGDLAAQDALPLDRHTAEDGAWVWKASMLATSPVEIRNNVPMVRSFEPWQSGMDKGEVYEGGPNVMTTGTGPYKAYIFTRHSGLIKEARAWCVGDLEKVTALLSRLTHIGKLSRLDFGRIESVDVKADEDTNAWKFRVIPWEADGYDKTHECVRPPYWKRENRVVAWRPRALL